ncbi:MFS transporter [Pyxidicoccus fallax]|uniref:MFS transporter n=3 Tax=Pyxidicoccus fallax TaxID=394095 RepID=A0A848LM33_9BACT|nr:MFS transporter [Pyxidicoccus fallax]NPC81405.1 MFS transporter [Pyxidicoccus fallax]
MGSQKKWLVMAVVSVALLLIVIDMTVLYTALPVMTHELGASASAKLWIINAYTLVVSGLLLGMGTLGDRLGHKRLFLAGLVVFGGASACAAFSPSAAALIASRAALGVGAAMMMPATLSIIRITFTHDRERALAIGIWAAVASGGAALGPVLGGLLLARFWWGSVFLVNVPIVLLTLPCAWKLIPASRGEASRPWDLAGSMQVMLGLAGVVYAIKECGKRAPSWTTALLTFGVGAAFLAMFARRQRRSAHPLVDFTLFRQPTFAAAVAAAVISSAALVGLQLVFSQRLQLVLGLSPLQAGLFTVPLPLASFVAGPLTGRILARVGDARVMATALLCAGLGMGGYLLAHDAPVVLQVASLLVLGAGIGATMTAASSTIMHRAPLERAGMAASIEEVSYELGGALGVTVMGSILSAVYTASLTVPAELALPSVVRDSLDEALLVAEGLPSASGLLIRTLARAAFDSAFVAVLATATGLLLAAAAWVWRCDRRETVRQGVHGLEAHRP